MNSELIRKIARFVLAGILILFFSTSAYTFLRRTIFKSEPTSSLRKENIKLYMQMPILIL